MFRRVDEHRHGRILNAVGQIGGANALASASVQFIAHDGHGEVDGFGMRFGRRGDGIKARLELAQDLDQLLGGELGLRIGLQDVDHLASVDPIVHHRLGFRVDEFGQLGGIRAFLEDGGEELPRRFAQRDLAGEHFTQSRVRAGHRFIAGQARGGEHGVDFHRAIGRKNAERITDFVNQTRTGQRHLEMKRLLARTGRGQTAGLGQARRKRILPRESRNCRGHSVEYADKDTILHVPNGPGARVGPRHIRL